MGNVQITSYGIRKALRRYNLEQAISEYIWNGFDANAKLVSLSFEANPIGGVQSFQIQDDGFGIPFCKLAQKFEPFLESEKEIEPNSRRTTSAVHGKNGVGRLTFFIFALEAIWTTVYHDNGKNWKYTVSVSVDSLNSYSFTEPIETVENTGTIVVFNGVSTINSYDFENHIYDYLVREFGWFLELNHEKGFLITIDGNRLDHSKIIGERENIFYKNDEYQFEIRYIRWKKSINKELSRYYFIGSDNNERYKDTTTLNYKGDNFFHSIYIKSNFFDNLYHQSNFSVEEDIQLLLPIGTQSNKVLKDLMSFVNSFLRDKRKPFLKVYTDILINDFERDGVFPPVNGNEWDKYRRSELEQVIRELYQVEPKLFTKLNLEQRKTFVHLLNLIMDSGERDRLLEVLGAIVELNSNDREELARLLRMAKLSNVVKTIKLIEDRFRAINELKEIVFSHKDVASEAHVQKFIENHYWILGEQYHLVTAAEPKFEEALRRFVYHLRGEKIDILIDHPDKQKEMDIFAVRQDIQNNIITSIVAELKNPRIKLGAEQLEQVKTYMRVIMKQDQFNASNMIWHFYLIGNSFDNSGYIENELDNATNHGEKHLVFKAKNYKIYVKKWSEIFADFDLRHKFLYERLELERHNLISNKNTSIEIANGVVYNSAIQPQQISVPSN
jgi:hypothetical protein